MRNNGEQKALGWYIHSTESKMLSSTSLISSKIIPTKMRIKERYPHVNKAWKNLLIAHLYDKKYSGRKQVTADCSLKTHTCTHTHTQRALVSMR